MNIVWQRIKLETPVFFKRLRNLAIYIGGSATAVITANATIPLNLPTKIITLCSYIIAICVAIAGTSQLTKKDK